MLSKNKINSIKKKPQTIYYIDFKQSGRIEFRFKKEEKLYREDGSLAFKDTRYENYIPNLSINKYTIYSGIAQGILYKEEEVFAYFEDDHNYELKDIEECFDSRELAIDDFLQKTTSYIIESIQHIYTINIEGLSINTKEKIKEFIKTLNDNGIEAKLIKGEIND